MDGNILNWIRDWLSGRRQRTVLNGEHSDWADVGPGVPQGSVLGPLAFLIFINDLDDYANEITLLGKFADDTKLGQAICSQEDIETLQSCFNNMVDWANTWAHWQGQSESTVQDGRLCTVHH